jgi:hypothetical protein
MRKGHSETGKWYFMCVTTRWSDLGPLRVFLFCTVKEKWYIIEVCWRTTEINASQLRSLLIPMLRYYSPSNTVTSWKISIQCPVKTSWVRNREKVEICRNHCERKRALGAQRRITRSWNLFATYTIGIENFEKRIYQENTDLARKTRTRTLILWEESLMNHHYLLEALALGYRHIMSAGKTGRRLPTNITRSRAYRMSIEHRHDNICALEKREKCHLSQIYVSTPDASNNSFKSWPLTLKIQPGQFLIEFST